MSRDIDLRIVAKLGQRDEIGAEPSLAALRAQASHRRQMADIAEADYQAARRAQAFPLRGYREMPPTPLQPVAFGKPDAALGRMVCAAVERCMPPTLTPWRFQQRRRVGENTLAGLGWIVLAGMLIGVLAMASR